MSDREVSFFMDFTGIPRGGWCIGHDHHMSPPERNGKQRIEKKTGNRKKKVKVNLRIPGFKN